MRKTDTAVVIRMEGLIANGELVLQSRQWTEGIIPPTEWVDAEPYVTWRAQSQHALTSLLGERTTYTQAFEQQVEPYARARHLIAGLGILKAIRADASAGHLFDTVDGLISAEIFSNFLDMAEHLLDQGYKQPAASLVGAVLEDGLRRIAGTKNIAVRDVDDISSLNQKLAQAGSYTAIIRSQIQSWKVVRDTADHGKFDELADEQVRDMHRGVKSFLGEHIG